MANAESLSETIGFFSKLIPFIFISSFPIKWNKKIELLALNIQLVFYFRNWIITELLPSFITSLSSPPHFISWGAMRSYSFSNMLCYALWQLFPCGVGFSILNGGISSTGNISVFQMSSYPNLMDDGMSIGEENKAL